jgi:hypothetical protein
MDSQTKQGLTKVIAALSEVAAEIRALEAQARDALYKHDDLKTHRKRMEEKAVLLMELHDRTWGLMDGMKADVRNEILMAIEGFAFRGEQATETASLFYMTALLYPEDYEEGDKNDLEKYIEDLQRRLDRESP